MGFFQFQKVQEKSEKATITFFQGLFTIVRKVCTLLPDYDLQSTLSQLIVHTFQCTRERNMAQASEDTSDPYLHI